MSPLLILLTSYRLVVGRPVVVGAGGWLCAGWIFWFLSFEELMRRHRIVLFVITTNDTKLDSSQASVIANGVRIWKRERYKSPPRRKPFGFSDARTTSKTARTNKDSELLLWSLQLASKQPYKIHSKSKQLYPSTLPLKLPQLTLHHPFIISQWLTQS